MTWEGASHGRKKKLYIRIFSSFGSFNFEDRPCCISRSKMKVFAWRWLCKKQEETPVDLVHIETRAPFGSLRSALALQWSSSPPDAPVTNHFPPGCPSAAEPKAQWGAEALSLYGSCGLWFYLPFSKWSPSFCSLGLFGYVWQGIERPAELQLLSSPGPLCTFKHEDAY